MKDSEKFFGRRAFMDCVKGVTLIYDIGIDMVISGGCERFWGWSWI